MNKEEMVKALANTGYEKTVETGKKYSRWIQVRTWVNLSDGRRVQVNGEMFIYEPKTDDEKPMAKTGAVL